MNVMDGISGLFSGRGPRNVESLFRFTKLSVSTQQYLARVYVTLAFAVAAAAVGCYASMRSGLGGGAWLPLAASFLGIPWLLSVPVTPGTLRKRRSILAGIAAAQGAGISSLVFAITALHPGVLLSALAGTVAVFAAFSVAALAAPRRSLLILGGVLGGVLGGLALARLGSLLAGGLGSASVFSAELTLGLAVFTLYVAYDTQVIIERAERGDSEDEVRAALELFTDAFAIFVRILIILARNAERRDDDGRDDRDQRRRRGATRTSRRT